LVFLTLPITVFTLGLFLLVINATIILIASNLLKDGFQVDGFWVAMLFSVVLSMVTSLLEKAAERSEGKTAG
jgi:putative membrane protein